MQNNIVQSVTFGRMGSAQTSVVHRGKLAVLHRVWSASRLTHLPSDITPHEVRPHTSRGKTSHLTRQDLTPHNGETSHLTTHNGESTEAGLPPVTRLHLADNRDKGYNMHL